MTNDYEYSDSIKWFDWPEVWRLDKDDEEQLKRDIDEAHKLYHFLFEMKRIKKSEQRKKK